MIIYSSISSATCFGLTSHQQVDQEYKKCTVYRLQLEYKWQSQIPTVDSMQLEREQPWE